MNSAYAAAFEADHAAHLIGQFGNAHVVADAEITWLLVRIDSSELLPDPISSVALRLLRTP